MNATPVLTVPTPEGGRVGGQVIFQWLQPSCGRRRSLADGGDHAIRVNKCMCARE
jgi:hypothetical protein